MPRSRVLQRTASRPSAGLLIRWLAAVALAGFSGRAGAQPANKMPVTTASPEARRLFLEGFDFIDRRRYADAYARCHEAAAVDPSLAVAHLCMYITAGSKTESLDELRRAVTLADKVTEPERLWILSDDAIVRGDGATEKADITRLVALLPGDEHSHNLLGAYYYRRRDYPAAIDAYLEATRIAPSYAQIYNQLGYSYEFLGRYAEAEAAFRKYTELLPGDPNPYDSYAELLMKTGNHRGSIQQYEKALAIDPKFATAFIGIGNDQIFLGSFGEARKTFARYLAAARSSEDARQAWLWTAVSYVHEGHIADALAAMARASTVADAAGDLRGVAASLHLAGDIALEAGRAGDAAALFDRQAGALNRTTVPDEVVAAGQRDARFDRGRLALARGDLPAARAERDALLRDAAAANAKPSLVQAHQLAGRIAIAEGEFKAAVAALEQADSKDPRSRFLLGVAVSRTGDIARARELFAEVVGWNAIDPNLGFVRAKAIAAAAQLSGRKR